MYKLIIKKSGNVQIKYNVETPTQLNNFFKLHTGVAYAQITTPSGVIKDITDYFK
tara:strand:- start:590 stop:754 length:165 start_codon:yes stop_codon:yes gene_type:complete